MKSTLFLDIVVRKGAAVLKLLSRKNQTLLVRRNAFLILNLCLHVVDSIRRFHLQGDGFASQGLDKNLHSAAKTENKMERRFFLNVIIGESATVLELLAGKDETLLIGRNAFFILNLCLHVVDGIRRFHLQGDSLASQGLDKDLHSTAKTENKVERRFLLDVVVGKSTTVLKLLASKDKTLLVGRNSFFILNLGFHVVDGVGRLNFEGDGFSGQGFDEYLHTATKTKNEMKSGFLLDVVIRKGTTILELLSSKDKTLLIRGDAFFILNLGLHIVDRVGGLDFQGDRFARKGLNKDLHTSTEAKNKMKSRLLLDVIIRQGAAILKLFAREDKALLVGGNTKDDG